MTALVHDSFPARFIGHASHHQVRVLPIGYGLMRLSWAEKETPDDQAFRALLAALAPLQTPQGENLACLLNTGDFYGNPPDRQTANLELLSRFLDRYPEYAQDGKVLLSVKGGLRVSEDGRLMGPDGSEEHLRKTVDNINHKLGGKKKMDLFQMARVDKTRPIEEVMGTLKTLIAEGKFKHIGLSEVSAQTIRRAHAVHPISAVEAEYSISATHIETNGVLATCHELGIPIVAYSPLGWGMLTGKIKSQDDLPASDHRHDFDRFQSENLSHNLKLAEKVQSVAKSKGCLPVQVCLTWLLAQSKLVIPIPGSTRPEGVAECIGSLDIQLSESELDDIRKMVTTHEVKGLRYNKMHQESLEV